MLEVECFCRSKLIAVYLIHHLCQCYHGENVTGKTVRCRLFNAAAERVMWRVRCNLFNQLTKQEVPLLPPKSLQVNELPSAPHQSVTDG